MEVETVWGVKWFIAGMREFTIALIIILIIIVILLIIKLYLKNNTTLSHEFQYVLFKAKSRGLTNFQYKIVRGMAEMLKLKHPVEIIDNPGTFEDSIASFISFLTTRQEQGTTLSSIFKAIVITYEKLYLDIRHKRPLQSFNDLHNGHLLYFYTDMDHIFIGKLVEQQKNFIKLRLFRKPNDLKHISIQDRVTVFIWRAGDAEYTFNSHIEDLSSNTVYLHKPETIKRGKEVRLPFVNVILPITIADNSEVAVEERRKATLFKIAEHEVVVRSAEQFNYSEQFHVWFSIEDFAIETDVVIISEKTVSDKEVFYYTFKFVKLSNPAQIVIRNYTYEHI